MIRILTILIIGFSVVSTHSQTTSTSSDEIKLAKNLTADVVRLFREKKYDDALIPAKRVASIYERVLGSEHLELARALFNLGFVQKFAGDVKESQKTLGRAFSIFQGYPQLDKADADMTTKVIEALAVMSYNARKIVESKKYFQMLTEAYQANGAGESESNAGAQMMLGNLFSAELNHSEAANFYEKSLAIRHKLFGARRFETQDSFDRCACSLKRAGKPEAIEQLRQKYIPEGKLSESGTITFLRKLNPASESSKSKGATALPDGDLGAMRSSDMINSGVINGKALALPKPAYPADARSARAEGKVNVTVKIDENGKVFFACGAFSDVHKSLIEASENAAYGARFSPTVLAGEKVRVTGVIIYSFMAP